MVPHVAVSALFRTVRRLIATVLVIVMMLIGIGGAVVAQAGRDETSSADTAVLMLDGGIGGEGARVDRAVRLYLAGQISRIVLAGSDPASARDTLVARGVVQDKIVEVREPAEIDQLRAVQRVLQEMRVADAMLLGEPVEALRLLK